MTAPLADLGIRLLTEEDIPRGLEIAREMYPTRDVDRAVPWVRWCMANPDRLALIGPNSVGCAQIDWIYGFEQRARLDFLACRRNKKAPLEALRMARVMLNWARSRGVKAPFTLDADTGVDFGPFSERLGGTKQVMVQYKIPLE